MARDLVMFLSASTWADTASMYEQYAKRFLTFVFTLQLSERLYTHAYISATGYCYACVCIIQFVPAICVAVRQRCLTLRDVHNAWFLYWYEVLAIIEQGKKGKVM